MCLHLQYLSIKTSYSSAVQEPHVASTRQLGSRINGQNGGTVSITLFLTSVTFFFSF